MVAFLYRQKEWDKQLNWELMNWEIPEKLCLWSTFLEELQVVVLILINITIYPVKEVPHKYSWSILLDDCKYLKSYFTVLFITKKKEVQSQSCISFSLVHCQPKSHHMFWNKMFQYFCCRCLRLVFWLACLCTNVNFRTGMTKGPVIHLMAITIMC